MHKVHRELLRQVQEAGITITAFDRRTNSYALDCEYQGRKCRYHVALTPSDWRAMKNAFHEIRRALIPELEVQHAN